jgi:hypothetical protein
MARAIPGINALSPGIAQDFIKYGKCSWFSLFPDTRPTDYFSGAKRLANQSFDRQIFLHNRTLRAHYAAKICPLTRHWAAAKLRNEHIKSLTFHTDVITMWILIKSRR